MSNPSPFALTQSEVQSTVNQSENYQSHSFTSDLDGQAAKLQAIQIRQQLGLQNLSISGLQKQSILGLLR